MTEGPTLGRDSAAVWESRPPLMHLDPEDRYRSDEVQLLHDVATSLRLIVDHLDRAEVASRGAVELLGTVARSKRFRTLFGGNHGN